jgi:hypothetical protein
MTKEHVYGDWMADLFPGQEPIRKRTTLLRDDPEADFTRREWVERDFRHQTRIRAFCDPCNGRLGAHFEDPLSGWLPAMIHGHPVSVLREGATRLAAWAAKVAILRELFDAPSQQIIEPWQRQQFHDTLLPPDGFVVYACTIWKHAERWKQLDRHSTFGLVPADVVGPDAIAYPPNAFVSTFGFGMLGLIVVGTTVAAPIRRITAYDVGALVNLWPDPHPFFWPMPEQLTDADLDWVSGDEPRLHFVIDDGLPIVPPP